MKGSVTNILEENVLQPLLVSTSAINLAAETVRSILKIDDIVSIKQFTRLFNHGVSGRIRGEWPSGLYSLRQVTEVKLGRVRSDIGWVTTEV